MQTTVWITKQLKDDLARKLESSPPVIHPGLIVSFALKEWVSGEWEPTGDLDGRKDERCFLEIDDGVLEAVTRRRQETGLPISPIYRMALSDWVSGKWDLGLVKACAQTN